MNPEFAIELVKSLMFQAVTLAAPILLTAMLIGINGRYKTHAGIRVMGLPRGDLFEPLRRSL